MRACGGESDPVTSPRVGTPACVLGLRERTGSIEAGKDADMRVRTMITDGTVVHGQLTHTTVSTADGRGQ